ncbi:MAG: hypothetical protein AB8G05_23370 [Oligoflexales bacterium]
MLSKILLVMFCLCPGFVSLGEQQDDQNFALFKYGIILPQLSKDMNELEKSVVQLRKYFGKARVKEIEISEFLQESVLKVSNLESQKSGELNEKIKIKIERKLARETSKTEDLGISLELQQRELEEIKNTLFRKEADLSSIRTMLRRLKNFCPLKKNIYEKFMVKAELASYWQVEFKQIVEAISTMSQPGVVLAAIDLDQSLVSLGQLNFLVTLSPEQVKAWKIAKNESKEDEQIKITDLGHIQNHYQLKILKYLFKKKIFKPKHLEDLKFINNRLLADTFVYLQENSEEAPSAFWQTISGVNLNWHNSPSYVFDSIKLLIQNLDKIHPDLWEVLPNWDNKNAFDSLNMLIGIDSMREKLSTWSHSNVKIDKLNKELRDLLMHSSRIITREQIQSFRYYCSLYGVDPNLQLERTILSLLGFKAQMLVDINTSAKLRGLMLLTKQYSVFMRKKRPEDYEKFPWEKVIKPFPFERLNDLNPYQVQAIEAYVEKKKTIPHLNEFPYIDNQYKYEAFKKALAAKKRFDPNVYEGMSSYLDVELFTLCLKHEGSLDLPMLYDSFRHVPYRLRSFAKQIYAQVLEDKNYNLSLKFLNTLSKINSISNLKILKYLVENDKQELIGDWVLTVDVEPKFELVKKCFENFENLPLSELKLILPQITRYDDLYLLEAMIAKGINIGESFERVKFASSLSEKISTLDLTEQYWKLHLDRILNAVPEEFDANLSEINKKSIKDSRFKKFLTTYDRSKKIKRLLGVSYLTLCRTPDCPGLLVPSKDSDVRYCSACNQATCGRCEQYAHSSTCETFEANNYKVGSRFYPGAANFRKGLRNVCFFNSLMKLMTQLVATVPEFDDFLSPEIDSEAFVKAGEGKTAEYNGLRRKLKFALHRWISIALRGYDLYDDKLADLSHRVLEPLESLLVLDDNVLSDALNRDQLDSWHILSILFSILGFEYTDLAIKVDQQLSLQKVDYVSHNQDSYSSLSVDIAGHSELSKAIDKMWDAETLDPDNWLRHTDGEKYETVKSIKMVNRPKLLVIHQKRFLQEKARFGRHWVEKKLTHAVKVSQHLKIPRFDKENQDEPAEILEYELVAMTLHKGNRIDAGHYIAYTVEHCSITEEVDRFAFLGKKRSFPYQFISHDDAKVDEVPSMVAASHSADHEAYLLAYRLKQGEDLD